jgi:predicted methyltransferase
VARFTASLIKLVPTREWGPPTFEIDGIKMLPTAQVSPYADAQRKVDLIQPRGKVILDTCGGLGYFAAWCLLGQATWPGCSSAKASCFNTPAHRTNSPADAMCLTKW